MTEHERPEDLEQKSTDSSPDTSEHEPHREADASEVADEAEVESVSPPDDEDGDATDAHGSGGPEPAQESASGVDAEQSECVDGEVSEDEGEGTDGDGSDISTDAPEEPVVIAEEKSAGDSSPSIPSAGTDAEPVATDEMVDRLTKALEIRDIRLEEWEETHEALQAEFQENQEAYEELESEHEALKEEREELNNRMLRAVADLENYRRRSEREKEELKRYGIDDVVSELIPVVDNMERALEHAEQREADSSLVDGVRMVYKQFLTALKKHGVEGFESEGEPFNPERHEAIQQVETPDHETGTVVEQFQKGYFLHDRLLRPALVSVAKRVETAQNEPSVSEDDEQEETMVDEAANSDEATDAEASQTPAQGDGSPPEDSPDAGEGQSTEGQAQPDESGNPEEGTSDESRPDGDDEDDTSTSDDS